MPGSVRWPALVYEQWSATCDTLHAHTQVLGKLAARLAPPEPQLQHAALRLTARGWETLPLPAPDGSGAIVVVVDLHAHQTALEHSDGRTRRVPLTPHRSVGEVTREVLAGVAELVGPVPFDPRPQETSWSIPLDEDDEHATYNPEQVSTYLDVATRAAGVLGEVRAPYRGRSTPVNAWWGSFDLAVSLFSGQSADPGASDYIRRNSMDAQEIAIGWWPGDTRYPKAAFYAYAHPAPDGYEQAVLEPPAARWEPKLGEYILDWDDVRRADDPHGTAVSFTSAAVHHSCTACEWDPALSSSLRDGMIPEWEAAAPSRKVRLRTLTELPAVGESDDSPDGDRTPPLSSLREVARSIYGADATGYAAGRPDYPEQLYRLLGQRCGLRTGSMVLEIGAGTGLVTRRLVADGAQVVAVEPDEGMAAHLSGSVGGHLDLVVDTFERASLPESHFDLAVAATSFHWVDQAVGLPKLGRLLRPGGWAAVWWTIFDDPGAQDPFRDALAQRWGRPDPGGQRNVGFQLDSAARCHDLRHLGGLDRVGCDKVRWTCELTAEQLSALYGSMITVRRLPGEEQRELLRAIAQLADRDFGGTVSRPFVTVVYTGRRPPPGRSEP